jgi:hypothetical protein
VTGDPIHPLLRFKETKGELLGHLRLSWPPGWTSGLQGGDLNFVNASKKRIRGYHVYDPLWVDTG